MLKKPAKLPLEASFAWLCGFIGTLHDGLVLLSKGKHEVNPKFDFTIPMSGWGTDKTVPTHSNYIDIEVEGLLDSDIVAVNVAPESVPAARAANFTSTESYAGKFRLRAENVPTAEIKAQYHIINTEPYEMEV